MLGVEEAGLAPLGERVSVAQGEHRGPVVTRVGDDLLDLVQVLVVLFGSLSLLLYFTAVADPQSGAPGQGGGEASAAPAHRSSV